MPLTSSKGFGGPHNIAFLVGIDEINTDTFEYVGASARSDCGNTAFRSG